MSRAGAPDATQLALGISEALVNTALGLTTAIIATVLYNYFTTRVDDFQQPGRGDVLRRSPAPGAERGVVGRGPSQSECVST